MTTPTPHVIRQDRRIIYVVKKPNHKPIVCEVCPTTGCHVCTSHPKEGKYYAKIKLNGKNVPIAHLIWEHTTGTPFPNDAVVSYTCSTNGCLNFDHMKIATAVSQGEANSHAKLTEDIVKVIRQLYNSGHFSLKSLSAHIANLYNIEISFGQVHNIVKYKSWKHVP